MLDGFELHDRVVMKKPHPCGANEWEILFIGADIKLKCLHCGRMLMLPRQNFTKSARRLIKNTHETENRNV